MQSGKQPVSMELSSPWNSSVTKQVAQPTGTTGVGILRFCARATTCSETIRVVPTFFVEFAILWYTSGKESGSSVSDPVNEHKVSYCPPIGYCAVSVLVHPFLRAKFLPSP